MGEFQERIRKIANCEVDKEGVETCAPVEVWEVEEVVEEAKKELFDYWRRNLIHEGLVKWLGSE